MNLLWFDIPGKRPRSWEQVGILWVLFPQIVRGIVDPEGGEYRGKPYEDFRTTPMTGFSKEDGSYSGSFHAEAELPEEDPAYQTDSRLAPKHIVESEDDVRIYDEIRQIHEDIQRIREERFRILMSCFRQENMDGMAYDLTKDICTRMARLGELNKQGYDTEPGVDGDQHIFEPEWPSEQEAFDPLKPIENGDIVSIGYSYNYELPLSHPEREILLMYPEFRELDTEVISEHFKDEVPAGLYRSQEHQMILKKVSRQLYRSLFIYYFAEHEIRKSLKEGHQAEERDERLESMLEYQWMLHRSIERMLLKYSVLEGLIAKDRQENEEAELVHIDESEATDDEWEDFRYDREQYAQVVEYSGELLHDFFHTVREGGADDHLVQLTRGVHEQLDQLCGESAYVAQFVQIHGHRAPDEDPVDGSLSADEIMAEDFGMSDEGQAVYYGYEGMPDDECKEDDALSFVLKIETTDLMKSILNILPTSEQVDPYLFSTSHMTPIMHTHVRNYPLHTILRGQILNIQIHRACLLFFHMHEHLRSSAEVPTREDIHEYMEPLKEYISTQNTRLASMFGSE